MAFPRPTDILDFWFSDAARTQWFARSDAFDEEVRRRLGAAHDLAGRGDLDDWKDRPDGALALVLLLDQAPRNLYRNSPRAFLFDAKALQVARHALMRGYDQSADPERRFFFYLPFEHSEALADQDECCRLVATLENPEYLRYAERHREIIARFGRFPHRNAVLGRESTAEEIAFLKEPMSSF